MQQNTFEIHTIEIAVMYDFTIIAFLNYFELVLNTESIEAFNNNYS